MLKIIELLLLVALLVMSFFAGVMINSTPKFEQKREESVLVIEEQNDFPMIKNEKPIEDKEEEAPKINELEIENNGESTDIEENKNTDEIIENKSDKDINAEETTKNNGKNDVYEKRNEVIPIAIPK